MNAKDLRPGDLARFSSGPDAMSFPTERSIWSDPGGPVGTFHEETSLCFVTGIVKINAVFIEIHGMFCCSRDGSKGRSGYIVAFPDELFDVVSGHEQQ